MDVLVLPSFGEGVPRSVKEAMALGNPVIGTRVGGIPELIIDEQTGFVVPQVDVPSLCKAVRDLADNKVVRVEFGARGRDRVRDPDSAGIRENSATRRASCS